MTPREQAPWKEHRYRQVEGKKFPGQHPVVNDLNRAEHFFHIPGFYCSEIKLAIELDGGIHRFQTEQDRKRDRVLQFMGIRVMRVRNDELANMAWVIRKTKVEILGATG